MEPTRTDLIRALGDIVEAFDDLGADRGRHPALADAVRRAGEMLLRVDEAELTKAEALIP